MLSTDRFQLQAKDAFNNPQFRAIILPPQLQKEHFCTIIGCCIFAIRDIKCFSSSLRLQRQRVSSSVRLIKDFRYVNFEQC
jgi:hypothetical protein